MKTILVPTDFSKKRLLRFIFIQKLFEEELTFVFLLSSILLAQVSKLTTAVYCKSEELINELLKKI
jgi:hypothetical protein